MKRRIKRHARAPGLFFLWDLVIGLGLPSSVNAGTNQKSISSRLRFGAQITSCRMSHATPSAWACLAPGYRKVLLSGAGPVKASSMVAREPLALRPEISGAKGGWQLMQRDAYRPTRRPERLGTIRGRHRFPATASAEWRWRTPLRSKCGACRQCTPATAARPRRPRPKTANRSVSGTQEWRRAAGKRPRNGPRHEGVEVTHAVRSVASHEVRLPDQLDAVREEVICRRNEFGRKDVFNPARLKSDGSRTRVDVLDRPSHARGPCPTLGGHADRAS